MKRIGLLLLILFATGCNPGSNINDYSTSTTIPETETTDTPPSETITLDTPQIEINKNAEIDKRRLDKLHANIYSDLIYSGKLKSDTKYVISYTIIPMDLMFEDNGNPFESSKYDYYSVTVNAFIANPAKDDAGGVFHPFQFYYYVRFEKDSSNIVYGMVW